MRNISKDDILLIIKEESEKSDVRKFTCINGFGYSQFERNIADRILSLQRKSIWNKFIKFILN